MLLGTLHLPDRLLIVLGAFFQHAAHKMKEKKVVIPERIF